jgi:hydrogenase nickel incorporation protein HypA/HybF
MHEMSIAASVLEAVRKESERHNARVTGVGLRIGEYSGVEPESLRFCLEVLTQGTEMDPLKLEIEFLPQGAELEFSYMEIEDP